ncbi:hypothetical protein SBA2_610024 [Acidobacteriia bacterium SbA2]|nr:hypothetical protein SBA2_610024 [Acidobacteriia bacterium SbA2]
MNALEFLPSRGTYFWSYSHSGHHVSFKVYRSALTLNQIRRARETPATFIVEPSGEEQHPLTEEGPPCRRAN